ncbi:D-alanyl-D-alanine carboxypeptidase [Patescibacteria group bacterium]|nr:D-alanyl-D-alanine carboxypeptidase [Patescibacteria group bacterium]
MKTPNLARRIQKEQSRFYWRLGIIVVAIIGILGIGTFFILNSFTDTVSAQIIRPPNIGDASSTPFSTKNAYVNLSLIGKAAVVYDLTTGKTLYAQNATTPLPLASITKLLTLYAASNVLQPSSPVVMTPLALAQNGDAADNGFTAGETFNFEDLARLTLAASSNDGAEAIVEAAGIQKNKDTSSLLASAAAAAGLTQTHANNSTGLDKDTEVSGGYGSAHDVAVLAGALIKKAPQIAQATTQPSVSIRSLEGIRHSFANTNIDVTHLPNLLLSKTGYTDLAGGNLVVVYDAGIGHPVAIVVLGSTETGRFTDVGQLMKATLAHFGGTVPS